MTRLQGLLIGSAAAAFVLGGVGFAVSQEGQPGDAQPAPAAATPPPSAPSRPAPSAPAGGEEAPPTAEAAVAAPGDPQAAAVEDQLTAAAEREASSRPVQAPARRRASSSGSGSGSGSGATEQVVAPAVAPVLPRQRLAVAVLQGLDKSTARSLRFYAPVGQTVRYEGLVVTARSCEQTNPEEARQDSWAYLDVFSQPRPVRGRPATEPRRVYRGWMSAQAPTVSPMQHPAYDVWLIECRASAPASTGGA